MADATEREAVPLEHLARVRPRTVMTIAALAGAFYLLLPQLANVDESISALGSANWRWLAVTALMSGCTYVAATIGMLGGIHERLPFLPTLQLSVASSFVNRVTPANVGGMALSVRFMQRAGIPPAHALTAVGLGVAVGGIVHVVLLAIFVAWAGRGDAGFSIPASSTVLVVLAVLSALVGLAVTTRRGRALLRSRVAPTLRQSWISIVELAHSPRHLAALVGGSVGVTLAYVGAMASTVAAFGGDLDLAQVGAVYLGAAAVAAAAPTPGGLGAVEAALVAGLTGLGMDAALAVAAVLTFRLVTFWLPVLPGWLLLRHLERHGFV